MPPSFRDFEGAWGENARLARDAIEMKPTRGIPQCMVHVMEIPIIEELSGRGPGEYRDAPRRVYLEMQKRVGTCMIDQFIPENPLTMTESGYDSSAPRTATTGVERLELDGVTIDSPEDVAEHMERFVFPGLEEERAACGPDDPARTGRLIEKECDTQGFFGPDILKAPYGRTFGDFPAFRYGTYGYANYFMAYALYPALMERDFFLQADLAAKRNGIAARAILEGGLPPVVRLDHDMADSRGTLVGIKSLDEIWFPPFARAVRPLLDAGVRLLWHCDGNLMQMVPRLIEAGVSGFQGFQYEDGMDYERICRMTDRDGGPLMIWAGVSVTRTLPLGTRDDVARELRWLVRHGPGVGLFLGASSSVTPGVGRENLRALFEGLRYYREHGRD